MDYTSRQLSGNQALTMGVSHYESWLKLTPGPVCAGTADSEYPSSYMIEREPVIRISTSLLALCRQSGPDAILETPIRARSKSNGSRSPRISPLLIARPTGA